MNQSAYSRMISCFISIFLSYFKQLSLVARGKTHTTKSVRACQLINCIDYSWCTQKYLCELCGGGFEQAKIFIKGAIIYFRIGGSWEKPVVTGLFFLKIGDHKYDEEIVWWLQNSKFCSMK